jgi:hypothetical protein
MGGLVFISYRSDVSADLAREIAEKIDLIEGMRAVKDVDFVRPADPIGTAIRQAIDRVDLILALIGPGWRIRSVDPTEDWVGFELDVAISSRKKILLVLHRGGSVPERCSLPQQLVQLSDQLAESISSNERSHETDIERLLVEVKRLAAGDKRRCLVVAAKDQAQLAHQIEEVLRRAGMDMLHTYVARVDDFHQMSRDAHRCHALVAISSEHDSDGAGDDLADPLVYARASKSMIYPVITDRPRSRFEGTYPGMQRRLDLRSSQSLPDDWITAIADGRNFKVPSPV